MFDFDSYQPILTDGATSSCLLKSLLQLWCMPDIGPKSILMLMPLLAKGWQLGDDFGAGFPKKQQQALRSKALQSKAREDALHVLAWSEAKEDRAIVAYWPSPLSLKEFEGYPPLLAQIHSPPSILTVQGDLRCLQACAVGIVGSRNPSREGALNAEAFSRFLVEQGLVVVSGGAAGIDRAAHEAALSQGGKTIAVLGHGFHHCYPASHRALFARIAEQGALVSEFPMNMGPRPAFFPRRNRIISGLSYGVCVVEAGLPSGSLVSAKWAYEQNREVFAVPGSIHNPRAKGCHSLIQQGAKLVQSGEDILEELAHLLPQSSATGSSESDRGKLDGSQSDSESYQSLSLEQKIVFHLTAGSLELHLLHERLKSVSVTELAATLTALEIDGVIVRDPGSGAFQRA